MWIKPITRISQPGRTPTLRFGSANDELALIKLKQQIANHEGDIPEPRRRIIQNLVNDLIANRPDAGAENLNLVQLLASIPMKHDAWKALMTRVKTGFAKRQEVYQTILASPLDGANDVVQAWLNRFRSSLQNKSELLTFPFVKQYFAFPPSGVSAQRAKAMQTLLNDINPVLLRWRDVDVFHAFATMPIPDERWRTQINLMKQSPTTRTKSANGVDLKEQLLANPDDLIPEPLLNLLSHPGSYSLPDSEVITELSQTILTTLEQQTIYPEKSTTQQHTKRHQSASWHWRVDGKSKVFCELEAKNIRDDGDGYLFMDYLFRITMPVRGKQNELQLDITYKQPNDTKNQPPQCGIQLAYWQNQKIYSQLTLPVKEDDIEWAEKLIDRFSECDIVKNPDAEDEDDGYDAD